MKTPTFPGDSHQFIGSLVIRGAQVGSIDELAHQLQQRQKRQYAFYQNTTADGTPFTIGNLELPSYLEHFGFFYIGSPGSGKTQLILANMHAISQRPNFRVVILDRNGEILEKFYDPAKFLIFNPQDVRSVRWSHRTEGVDFEMTASSLIPKDNHPDQFWREAAIQLLSGIYQLANTNEEVYHWLQAPTEVLASHIPGLEWMRDSEKAAACVLATAKAYSGFYRYLPDQGEPFSFFHWAASNDPRSLIIPLFTDKMDRFKALTTMAIRQVLKGLICNEEQRTVQTAVIIDELGALYALDELMDVLAQGRKFKTCFIGATQTLAQVEKVYGRPGVDTLLQTVRTKVILNCPDYSSAQTLAQCIGMQERLDIIKSVTSTGEVTYAEHYRESYAVHPSELQQLPPLTGYVHISEGLPTALVSIQPMAYPPQAPRRLPRPEQQRRPKPLWNSSGDKQQLQFYTRKEDCLLEYVAERLWHLSLGIELLNSTLENRTLDSQKYCFCRDTFESRLQEDWQAIESQLRKRLSKLSLEQKQQFIKDTALVILAKVAAKQDKSKQL